MQKARWHRPSTQVEVEVVVVVVDDDDVEAFGTKQLQRLDRLLVAVQVKKSENSVPTEV